MDLKATIQNDMKTAMKAHDQVKVDALRMLISEIKKREIDKRAPLDEGEIQKTVATLIKQRNDSIDAFNKGGRTDLAEKENREIGFLKVYVPAQMSAAEVEAIVVAAIKEVGATKAQDIGQVMKAALAKAAGKADGKTINEIARAKLSQS